MGRERWIGALGALMVLWGAGAAQANQLTTITIPARAGEIPPQWYGYSGPPRADVLLPTGYDPAKAYPLLILLHGLGDSYAYYAQHGIQQILSGMQAIVVMPEGASGWYADWWNNGERSRPSWETYELNDVLPAILTRYRILPQRRNHAIGGISMGGLGATYLGGRLPGFFGSVGSFSGFVDTQIYPVALSAGEPVVSYAPLAGDDDLNAVFGPENGFYSTGHNPTKLASNLLQTRVFESTGDGIPSSAGVSGPHGAATGLAEESPIIYPMNMHYHAALVAAGVNVTYQVHPGIHDAPDFMLEVRAFAAWNPFKPVVGHPRSWVNKTVATAGRLWDVDYRFDTPPTHVAQFTRNGNLLSVSVAGSAVTLTVGSCSLHLVTPASISLARCLTTRRHTKAPRPQPALAARPGNLRRTAAMP